MARNPKKKTDEPVPEVARIKGSGFVFGLLQALTGKNKGEE
jgi:hypothetical protein